MMMAKVAPALDPALIERVENLQTTAEYLTCLVETVLEASRETRDAIKRGPAQGMLSQQVADLFAATGQWRQIETFCNLALDQIAIVQSVAQDVDTAGHRGVPLPAGFAPFNGIAA